MPALQLVTQVEMDGHPIDGSPFSFLLDATLAPAQVMPFGPILVPVTAVGVFTAVPLPPGITTLSSLVLSNPDAQLRYRIADQTDKGLLVNAGGIFVLVGAAITGTSPLLVENSSSGAVAQLIGYVAGS